MAPLQVTLKDQIQRVGKALRKEKSSSKSAKDTKSAAAAAGLADDAPPSDAICIARSPLDGLDGSGAGSDAATRSTDDVSCAARGGADQGDGDDEEAPSEYGSAASGSPRTSTSGSDDDDDDRASGGAASGSGSGSGAPPDAEALIAGAAAAAAVAPPLALDDGGVAPCVDPNAAGADDAVGKRSIWSLVERSCAEKVLPRHRPSMPTLDEIRASPDAPVFVTRDPTVPAVSYNGHRDLRTLIPLNRAPIEIDGPLFRGQLQVEFRGLPSSNPEVWDGKKRCMHIAAQGRFKRRLRAAAHVVGQEFNIPIYGGRAAEFIMEQILRACAKVFSRTTIVDAHGARPYFLNPLIAAAQIINVAKPGEEPPIWDAEEDCRLLHPALAGADGAPMAAEKRRRWCDEPKNVEGMYFDTEHVYTLHLWQHMLDFASYRVSVGGLMSFDVCQVLSSQPLQLKVKDLDSGVYTYAMLVWHERLLYPDAAAEDRAREAKEARDAAAAAGGGGARARLRGLWSRVAPA